MNKQFLVAMISNAQDALVRTVKAVPEDKLNWRPLDSGRSILDLLGDAAQTPVLGTQLLSPGGITEPISDIFARLTAERANWTREECLQKLDENCKAMFAALDAFPEADLMQPVTITMGSRGDMTLPVAIWVLMAHRTFSHRFAQINYIQTLYGDLEMH